MRVNPITAPGPKRCSKCGETKPSADFNRAAQNLDGLKAVCRACQAAYHQANRERQVARSAAYYAANQERLVAEAAAYRAQHPERVIAARAKYIAVNAQRLGDQRAAARDLTRERRTAHRAARLAAPPPDVKRCPACRETKPVSAFHLSQSSYDGRQSRCSSCQLAYAAAWNAAHPERASAKCARYHVGHRARVSARQAAYRAAHPDLFRRIAHNRRARLRGAPTFGRVSFREVRERDGDVCWLCGKPVDSKTRSYDHAIPLAKGGEHSTRNIRVAHRRCNSAKRTRLVTHQRFLF